MKRRSQTVTAGILLASSSALPACTKSSATAPALGYENSVQSVHTFITGSDAMGSLKEITSYPWPDKGKRAGDPFVVIGRAAPAMDTEKSAMAGQSARGLANFLADNADSLLKADGGKSVGSLNPILLQSYASALIPYLGAMVGDDRGTRDFAPIDDPNSRMTKTGAVFASLDGAPGSTVDFNSAARQRANGYIDAFATAAQADSTPDANALSYAARLLGLVQAGIAQAQGTSPDTSAASRDFDEVAYTVAARLVRGPNKDIVAKYFTPAGVLMSPNQVRADMDEAGYREYTTQVDDFLMNQTELWDAVKSFRDQYYFIIDPQFEPHR